jgi:eukaryotic-like serine/threonine-protein kinase
MEQVTSETPLLNNRYLLEQTLGSGGMAVVYRARDLMLERSVAIKLLREDFSKDEAFRNRFHQEAKAVANLSHPNIVTVHDFGLDGGRLFIVMEYVHGQDLKGILRQRGRLPLEEALQIIIQTCAGVGYAHRAGFIHCDLKPHNILVSVDQRVKVTDFGIARALATIQPEEKSDMVWGSPQYFSPEQATGAAPSPASDVYSLGVILYEMLAGQLPFNAATPAELARLHRDAAPPPPRQFNAAIPPRLEELILKVLSKEPSARFRTADQFGRVLITIQQEQGFAPVYNPGFSPVLPGAITAQAGSAQEPEPPSDAPIDTTFDIDWITIGLGLLTVLAVGGLIPFWLAVWFTFNPIITH